MKSFTRSVLLLTSLSLTLVACESENASTNDTSAANDPNANGALVQGNAAQVASEAADLLKSNDMEALLREIRITAGVARASHLDQCKLLSVGAKPCGGPERYVLYSTENADETTLKALAERYTELAKQRNEREGLISDCSVITPPNLSLVGGVCVPLTTATQ